ncbi:MAG TPA: hypothetical protein RMF84_00405 [Polyangiaceae bacterium LLY-WYZ-14_1]|nr:hypothetical protein [Polyangiaceae bacterium LLY-WYZ-14_1]
MSETAASPGTAAGTGGPGLSAANREASERVATPADASRFAPAASVFAAHPGKRRTELVWLAYTPVWGLAAAVVMMGGLANTWGDWELTAFCSALGLGAFVAPVVFRPAEERGLPFWETAGFKMSCCVAGLAVLINYSHSPFFFDVLHMHYGFDTTWNVRQTPIGLYIITIAYFATYAVLCLIAFRWLRGRTRRWPLGLRWPAYALAPFGVAFLETLLNANPFMTHLFCYDDIGFALSFGTLAYGTAFCFTLPAWLRIDERPGVSVTLFSIAVSVLAAVYAEMLVLDLLRHFVAPLLTEVETGAMGFRDFAESCLEPLPGSP